MYHKNYSVISLLLILALILPMASVFVTPDRASAAATAVTLISPTSDNSTNTAYVKAGGSVNVSYFLDGAGGDSNAVQIQITNGSTPDIGSASVSRASGAIYTEAVLISSSAANGLYNVIIADGSGHTASSTGAVVVDNTAPTVSIALPNASSCWASPSSQTVQWASSDAASTDNVLVYAYMSTDSGSSYPNAIQAGVSWAQGAQIYSYSVPGAISSSTCKVTVWVKDRAGNSSDNATTSLFSILGTAPVPVVTAPNGSEIWNGASSQNITGTVTFTGSSFQYLLSLSTDSGATWSENITSSWVTVTGTSPYTLTYPWTVSNSVRSSTCRIRLLARDCALNIGTDTSNANFRIKDVTAPTVTVTAPTTGQTWYAGVANNITWTQTDNIPGNLLTSIYYSTDGSDPSLLIITDTSYAQGSNSYAWTIPPGTSSTNCKIKIIAKDGETPVNTSTPAYSGTFTISSGGVPTVTLCTPNGAENWQVGSTQTITWTCSDSLDATARMTYVIQLSTDSGGTWPTTIATLSNQTQASSCGGSYSWAVSDSACTTAMIKITATNAAGSSASDQSNAVFTITAASCAVETGTIALDSGWNLISLPLWPTSTNIDTLLSSQMANVISVWYYTGGGSGSWLSYAPGAPSTLTTLEGGKAYWVNMTTGGPFTLSFQGRKCPCPPASPTTITVSTTGWNMIGFKSSTAKAVSSYFTSLGTCGTAYLSPINGYTSGAWSSVNCSDNMTSGRGYWVYINSTGIINPGCE